ncbi:MAG: hypothetical protein ABL996_18250 [Micropepsaceae bacterium]
MFGDLQALIFALAIGIVISGIFANVFELVTNTQSVFHLPVTSDARRLVIVGILLFAAPHIVMCAAGRVLREGEMAPAQTLVVCAVCSLWSFAFGFLVFKLMVS